MSCLQCGHISRACSKCGHNYQACHDGGENSIMLFGVKITGAANNTASTNSLSQYQQLTPQVSSGYNSQTCNDGEENSIMLFGVKITRATNNKNNTTNNISQYQQPTPQVSSSIDASIVSDNFVNASTGSRKCKRFNEGTWTEKEHVMFLKGLKHIGKGKWKEISQHFVKTRSPTQVASHAQKHSVRRPNQNRRRNGKPSVFDLTIDTEMESSTIMEDEQIQQETTVSLPPPIPTVYPSTQNGGSPTVSPLPIVLGQVALPVWPLSWVDLNGNRYFSISSLKPQSLPSSDDHSPETSGHSSPSTSSSAFNSMSTWNSSGGSGHNIANVARKI